MRTLKKPEMTDKKPATIAEIAVRVLPRAKAAVAMRRVRPTEISVTWSWRVREWRRLTTA